jgi:hypothetical protein
MRRPARSLPVSAAWACLVVLCLGLALLPTSAVAQHRGHSHSYRAYSSLPRSYGHGVHSRTYATRSYARRTYQLTRSHRPHSQAYSSDQRTHFSRGLRKQPYHGATRPYAISGTRDHRGRLKRNAGAKHQFMRQTGHPGGWPGHVVDHRIPLACGGSDTPSNMQWQTTDGAKAKDRIERRLCAR